MTYFIGIDIGGTNIKYGLLTSEGKIIEDSQIRTSSSGDAIINNIKEIVETYKNKYSIKAVGVSAPGVILDNGYMVTGGAIHDFYGINLKERIENVVGLPTFVENDANCAALAEKWLGMGKNYKHFLTVVVGTGVGGAIIINDHLFRGANSTAGEFGFMLVDPIENEDARLSTLSLTGSIGCGVVDKYKEQAPTSNDEKIDGEKIFRESQENNLLAKEIVENFYDKLAIGIFNMAVSFDPEVVLIGGAISSDPVFIKKLNEHVASIKKQHRDMGTIKLPKILPCHFFNKAGIVGATYKAKISIKESNN